MIDAQPSTPHQVDPDMPLGKQVSLLLFELNGRMRAHMEHVAEAVGLTPTQARTLHHLAEPCPMGEVAERMRCDASNITGVVDRLAERDLVVREQDPDDRRRRVLVLTEEGQRLRQEMHERIPHGHPLAGLTPAQQRQLRDLLVAALD